MAAAGTASDPRATNEGKSYSGGNELSQTHLRSEYYLPDIPLQVDSLTAVGTVAVPKEQEGIILLILII